MFFRRLRDMREDSDLKQADIAEYLGIAQTVYSRYERGFRTIPLEHLIRLADLYKVSVDYLIERSDFSEVAMKIEYKSLYEKFGLNVVYYRKRKKLTQLQLAELADIDRSHISAIELGNVGVSFDVIFKLCEVLEVKPRELFDFRD